MLLGQMMVAKRMQKKLPDRRPMVVTRVMILGDLIRKLAVRVE
jgi:hypothetical protein